MTRTRSRSLPFAALLLLAAAWPAAAQTDRQAEDPHHPAGTEGAPAPQAAAPGEGMAGMMTPEMMQMMQRMMGGMGGMGSSMMGQGPMPMAGGMMMCPMMQMPMMGGGRGTAMPGMMGGADLLYGAPHRAEEMTPERVRALLEQRLAEHGNPRLEIGEIAVAADGSITAEIVTVDGSLVQKLAFNRYPGLVRQIVE